MIYDVNYENLEFCYLKLKSHYFYNSNPLFMKEKIVEFEGDIEKKLKKLVKNYEDNNLDNYITKIRYCILPKKNKIKEDENSINIYDFNFFIDCPIEIYLLDILWIFNLLELADLSLYNNIYGNKLNYYILNDELNEKLYNRNIFENYNKLYLSWKNDCFKSVEEKNRSSDLVILDLDLKKYYYSISFRFDDVYSILGISKKNNNVESRLNNFIKRIYCYYDAVIKETYNYEHLHNEVSLPIGLISSAIISNYILKDFDKSINKNKDVVYYGRYVDDILLVLKSKKIESSIRNYLDEYFPNVFSFANGIEINKKNCKYMLKSISINSEKCQFFYIKKGDFSNTKFKKLLKEKIICSFEDESLDSENENYDEVNISNTPIINLRNLLYNTNNLVKNSEQEINEILYDAINENKLIGYYSLLTQIFLFLKNNEDLSNKIYESFIEQTKKLTILDNDLINISKYESKMKEHLIRELNIAKDLVNDNSKYKECYMSYINDEEIIDYITQQNIIEAKKIYFPKNISSEEILYSFCLNKNIDKIDIKSELKEVFYKINYYYPNLKFNIKKNGKKITINNMKREIEREETVNIAIASLNYNKEDVVRYITSNKFLLKTSDIFKLIDYSVKQNANYLLLPEFAISPYQVITVLKYARKKRISIISGLSPFITNGNVKNFVWFYDEKLSVSFAREKNEYPLEEIQVYLGLGFKCDKPNKKYYIVNNGLISYGQMLCFEATSIGDRAMHKNLVDVLFCPVLNRDTKYFSNILCSFARDARIFIVQSNVNAYGDSRIIAPFKSDYSDIIKIKGGINNYIVVGNVDFSQINQYKKFELKVEKILRSKLTNDIKNKEINKLKDKYKIRKNEQTALIAKPKSAE